MTEPIPRPPDPTPDPRVGLLLLRGLAAGGDLDTAVPVSPGIPAKPLRDWTIADVRTAFPPAIAHHIVVAMTGHGMTRVGEINRDISLVTLEELLFPAPDKIDLAAARQTVERLVDRWGHDRICAMLCELGDLERGTRVDGDNE